MTDQLAAIFKVLGHPFRITLIRLLAQEEEACVCHLEALTGQRQAYISQHLARLREAGLVTSERNGMNVFYQLSDPMIIDVILDAHRTLCEGPIPSPNQQAVACDCPTCTEPITIQET